MVSSYWRIATQLDLQTFRALRSIKPSSSPDHPFHVWNLSQTEGIVCLVFSNS